MLAGDKGKQQQRGRRKEAWKEMKKKHKHKSHFEMKRSKTIKVKRLLLFIPVRKGMKSYINFMAIAFVSFQLMTFDFAHFSVHSLCWRLFNLMP